MKASVLWGAGATAVVLAIVACSQDTALPPPDQDCVHVDGGSCAPIVTGGSSGSGEGGADSGTCSVSAGSSQCGLCETDKCCSVLEECFASTNVDCKNLYDCEMACLGGSICLTACQNEFPTGVSTLQLISSCVTQECPVCNESGIGDPCGSQYPACEAGLTCNGQWCTKTCARSTDCTGLGPGGDNTLGFANVCMSTPGGDFCTPTCVASSSSCADFIGTYCFATTAVDGTGVSVCTVLPDASTAD